MNIVGFYFKITFKPKNGGRLALKCPTYKELGLCYRIQSVSHELLG